jgi:outer membrane protein TolC
MWSSECDRASDADRQLLAARDDLVNDQVEVARAAVRSFRALGGGWNS